MKDEFPLIPVPRHKGDIPKGTAKNIMKCAGLKPNLPPMKGRFEIIFSLEARTKGSENK